MPAEVLAHLDEVLDEGSNRRRAVLRVAVPSVVQEVVIMLGRLDNGLQAGEHELRGRHIPRSDEDRDAAGCCWVGETRFQAADHLFVERYQDIRLDAPAAGRRSWCGGLTRQTPRTGCYTVVAAVLQQMSFHAANSRSADSTLLLGVREIPTLLRSFLRS